MRDNTEYTAQLIGQIALKAVLYEVSCFPKPGLVSPVSSGAHSDMDYFTFLKSSVALAPYFSLFAKCGMTEKPPKEILGDMRAIGMDAEKKMFEATSGVNTHKGMIFLMGIACAAAGYVSYHEIPFDQMQTVIKEMTRDLVKNDLGNLHTKKRLTHGEKLYLMYNIEGVRGEAEKGLPCVFEQGIPGYKSFKHLDQNAQLINTLFRIMSCCEDTTILYRHSYDVLQLVKSDASEFLALGGIETEPAKAFLFALEKRYCEARISPGGSADLLAVTVFISELEVLLKKCE